MTTRYLLFVEDRDEQHMLFRDEIADWNEANAGHGRRFEADVVATYEAAIRALERTHYDGALVDLRLPRPDGNNGEAPLGNELAEKSLRENGIPVAIITALKTELAPEIAGSDLIRVFDKGDADPYKAPVAWFGDKWLMMEVLANARATMRRLSADVFADRIWPRWGSYLEATGSDPAQLSPIVTRQKVWHMGEVLGLDGDDSVLWHPFENYVCPPLQPDRAHTGDLFDLDGQLWVVLSPPCDMATRKIDDVLLALCDRDAIADWPARLEKLKGAKDEEQRASYSKFFRGLVNQGDAARHFLPPLPGDPRPVMVLFSRLTTRPLVDLQGQLKKRVASVSAPFIANLTQRFGAYISRVGQPNIDAVHFLQG